MSALEQGVGVVFLLQLWKPGAVIMWPYPISVQNNCYGGNRVVVRASKIALRFTRARHWHSRSKFRRHQRLVSESCFDPRDKRSGDIYAVRTPVTREYYVCNICKYYVIMLSLLVVDISLTRHLGEGEDDYTFSKNVLTIRTHVARYVLTYISPSATTLSHFQVLSISCFLTPSLHHRPCKCSIFRVHYRIPSSRLTYAVDVGSLSIK